MTAEVHDRTVVDGELRIALRDYSGSGRPIVLVHGGGDNLETWAVVAPLLSAAASCGGPRSSRARLVVDAGPCVERGVCRCTARGHHRARSGGCLAGWSFHRRASGRALCSQLALCGCRHGRRDVLAVSSGRSTSERRTVRRDDCRDGVRLEGRRRGARNRTGTPARTASRGRETICPSAEAQGAKLRPSRRSLRAPPHRRARRAQVHWVPGEHPSYANDPDQFARIRCPIRGVFGTTGPNSNERDEVEEPFRSNDNADVHWLKGGHFLPFEDPTGVVGLIESAMPE